MKRAYDELLQRYLNYFPCVSLVGARQCGKTTLLNQLPAGWKKFDFEKTADLQTIARDPDLFLRLNPSLVAIDESQILPELFPALRVAIDQDRGKKGRFVITGSSSPSLVQAISESLAGRVGMIEMAPFSFAESQGHTDVPFIDAIQSKKPMESLLALNSRSSLRAIHDYWFRGGYPEPWVSADEMFRGVWLDQYISTYILRDMARLFPGLNQTRFQRFLYLLAGLSGSTINYSDVARALDVSAPTVRTYFEIAEGCFLWRELSAFEKKAMKRLVRHPKGYLRDTGLLHRFLKIPDSAALLNHPQMGQSWEGMVIEEVLRGLNAVGKKVEAGYYRTFAGAEVDLVLEGDFGLLPIEIKYASFVDPRALRALNDFIEERKCAYGIVIHNGERPTQIDNKIIALPFSCF